MEPIGGEEPEAQYEYCCNIHIIRAVKLVAICGLVLNPLWAIYMFESSPITPYDFALVFLCLYALILVAVRKENARLLIPFLIFNGLLIGGRIIYCIAVMFTISSKWFWDRWSQQHPGQDPNPYKAALIVHLVINVVKVLLNIWFEHVIYRGFLFLQSRGEQQPLLVAQPAPPTHPTPNHPPPMQPQPPPQNPFEPHPMSAPPPYGQVAGSDEEKYPTAVVASSPAASAGGGVSGGGSYYQY